MTQEEKWQVKYDEVVHFIETNKRNPSKHRIEEHLMLNWIKHQRKLLNVGKMKAERVEMFERLLVLVEQYRHVIISVDLLSEKTERTRKRSGSGLGNGYWPAFFCKKTR